MSQRLAACVTTLQTRACHFPAQKRSFLGCHSTHTSAFPVPSGLFHFVLQEHAPKRASSLFCTWSGWRPGGVRAHWTAPCNRQLSPALRVTEGCPTNIANALPSLTLQGGLRIFIQIKILDLGICILHILTLLLLFIVLPQSCIKNSCKALTGVTQWVGRQPTERKVAGSTPDRGHLPGLWDWVLVGKCTRSN